MFLRTRLEEIDATPKDLAAATGFRDAKIHSILTARHFLPLEFIEPFAKFLRVCESELVALAMLQHYPPDTVRFVFEAVERDIMTGKELPWQYLRQPSDADAV